jgi:putative flippase GtrA
MCKLGIGMCPDINDLVISFIIGNETHVIVIPYLINLIIGLISTSVSFSAGIITSFRLNDKTTFKGHVISKSFISSRN